MRKFEIGDTVRVNGQRPSYLWEDYRIRTGRVGEVIGHNYDALQQHTYYDVEFPKTLVNKKCVVSVRATVLDSM